MRILLVIFTFIIAGSFYRIGKIKGRESYREEMKKKIEEIEERLTGVK